MTDHDELDETLLGLALLLRESERQHRERELLALRRDCDELAARVAQLEAPPARPHGDMRSGWRSSNRPGTRAISTRPCRRCHRPTARPRWCTDCVGVVYQSRTGPVKFTFDQLPVGLDGVGLG